MISIRTIACLLTIAFLVSAVPSCASLKPKEPVTAASIRVVDRFGSPIEGIDVSVSRKKKRREMMEMPYETIALATSNADGRVNFQNLLEGDGAGAKSRDRRFHGGVELEPATTDYEIRLDQHAGIAVAYRSGITESGLHEDGSKAAKSLVKILDHHVATESREFLSLSEYVDNQIVSRDEANEILQLAPFMTTGDRSINFLWGDHRLRVENEKSSLRWIATKDNGA